MFNGGVPVRWAGALSLEWPTFFTDSDEGECLELAETEEMTVGRYRSLGLIGNPFPAVAASGETRAITAEVNATVHGFLTALDQAADTEKARPIWVEKTDNVPSYYHLRTIAQAESIMATDTDFNVLHAYMQLYMMRTGRVRSTLAVVAERLAFTRFEDTLVAYVRGVLDKPDESLPSYQALTAGALDSFTQLFASDPFAAIEAVFGDDEVERVPDLAEVADSRLVEVEGDIDEEESDGEVDSTLGNAPGALMLAQERVEDQYSSVADYLIDYTREHLSPVVARALRQRKDRGMFATINEFKVTKAPSKTLKALCSMASLQFRKVALIYDGFENWVGIEGPIKGKVLSSLTDIRWGLETHAVMAFLVETDAAPELEEQFGHSIRQRWDFPNLERVQEGDEFYPEVIDGWLAAATVAGSDPLTLAHPVLSALASETSGMNEFLARAAVAVDDAAARAVETLDEDSLAAARSAEIVEPAE